jgi:uncharacterized protein YifE (UPF0438 family)
VSDESVSDECRVFVAVLCGHHQAKSKKTTKYTKKYKKIQQVIGRYTVSAVTFWVMSEAWSWY